MQTVLILGRQPAIGLAELESLYGVDAVRPVGSEVAIVDAEVDFLRLGASVKAARLVHILDSTNWKEIQNYLQYSASDYLKDLPEGRLSLGISAYGFDISPQRIMATGLNLKKVIRLTGRSVRLVPNKEITLNSAQVIHNKLTESLGWELLIIRDGNKTIIARTVAEQDIEAYTLRDRGRPKRDARVGMLPPKLAQTIVNLAASTLTSRREKLKILDPFCGTGVILQEAGLVGYGVYGTDMDQRMVDYSQENLNWLVKNSAYKGFDSRFEVADATSYQWPHEFDVVASEAYLGRPFTSPPPPDMLEKNRRDCDTILRKFLINMRSQTKPGTRLCLAVPAWFVDGKVYRLPLVDSLEEIGYNRIDFRYASAKDLIYHRDGQIVGRELLVLVRS